MAHICRKLHINEDELKIVIVNMYQWINQITCKIYNFHLQVLQFFTFKFLSGDGEYEGEHL